MAKTTKILECCIRPASGGFGEFEGGEWFDAGCDAPALDGDGADWSGRTRLWSFGRFGKQVGEIQYGEFDGAKFARVEVEVED